MNLSKTKELLCSKKSLIFSFLIAVFILGICSKSSPIYPLNDWVDANAFFTVGKSMLQGLVPYRDLFEHKGPILYTIHALGAVISPKSFFGVWVFEVIAATLFLYICDKIIRLYVKHKNSYIYLPILAVLVFSSNSFSHGDSAEEFSLPILAYALYVGLKAIKNNQMPNRNESFIIGLSSACILWIKFTLLGLYIGWFIFFLIFAIVKKQLAQFGKTLIFIILGVAATSSIVLLYFLINGALKDLFQVYFYNNIFSYSASPVKQDNLHTFFKKMHTGVNIAKIYQPSLIVSAILGTIYFIKSKKIAKLLFIISSGAFLFIFIYIGNLILIYHSLILFVFIPFLIPLADELICKIKIKRLSAYTKAAAYIGTVAVFVTSCYAAYSLSENTYLIEYKKSDMPQYKFAEIINKKEEATLLNFAFLDGGFYTASGIVPNEKYFYRPNMDLEEVKNGQLSCVKNKQVDFIVTRNMDKSFDGYKQIATADFHFEGFDFTYYLYQLELLATS